MCRQRGFDVDSGIVVTNSTNGGFSKFVPLPNSPCFECHIMTGNFIINYSCPGVFGTRCFKNEKHRIILVQSQGYLLIYMIETKFKGFLLDLKQAKKIGFVSARKMKNQGNSVIEICTNKVNLIYSFGTMEIDFLNNVESMRWMLALTAVHGGTQILMDPNPKIWNDGHLMYNPELIRTRSQKTDQTEFQQLMITKTKSESEIKGQKTADQTFVKTVSTVLTTKSSSTESIKSSTIELDSKNDAEKLKEIASNSSHPPTPVVSTKTKQETLSNSETPKNLPSVFTSSDILERNVFESEIDCSVRIFTLMKDESTTETVSLASILSEASERTVLQQKMTEEFKHLDLDKNEEKLFRIPELEEACQDHSNEDPSKIVINKNEEPKVANIFDHSTMFANDDEPMDTVSLINRGLIRAADLFSAKMANNEVSLHTVSSCSSWKDSTSPRSSFRLSEPVPICARPQLDFQRSCSLKTNENVLVNYWRKVESEKTLSRSFSGPKDFDKKITRF